MSTPNIQLAAARKRLALSQDDFARAIRAAGLRNGDPNSASKRLVQQWESGSTVMPSPLYIRALQAVTGLPIEQLGFPSGAARVVVDDGRGGHDLEVRPPAPLTADAPQTTDGFNGVWLSQYEYFSSGRDQAFQQFHHAIVLQHGDRLTVRSLPDSAHPGKSTMEMDLTVDGSVVTGTWVEQTSTDNYYRGARYHGAIQLLAEPTRRRLTGKWVGFGKSGETNTGPWTLSFLDASTSVATLDRYNRPPETAGE
jgi:transcriptional regulator with XRE-family HTH domain